METNPITEIESNINVASEKIIAKDFKFYHVQLIPRIANLTHIHSDKCSICSENMKVVTELSLNVANLLNSSIQNRNTYDNTLSNLKSHLKNAHQYYPKSYFSSLYTFYGMIGGAIVGLLIFAIQLIDFKIGLLIFSAIGLFTGKIAGYYKDKRNEKNKLIL